MDLFKNIYKHHLQFWNKKTATSLMIGAALFIVALIVQHFVDNYVGRIKGIAVGDLVLDHIPTVNLDIFIVQGALLSTLLILILLVFKPRYLNFSIKALAIFILVRSFSISLTHLGVNPHQLTLDTDGFGYGLYNIIFNTKGDFFFSGHTGVPFLMSLIYWHERFWRYLFLAIALVFAASVLFAHIHYSIDVFAAPFMTYGIFTISKYVFRRDYKEITTLDIP